MVELMLTSAGDALVLLFDPDRLALLVSGVLIGLVLGVIPGLGGLVGLTLLLPFTFDMDPYAALAMMMGLAAVAVTSDSIPAILFGVPGTVASAATILDGFPMARRGEAGRAFGAAFSASVMGGLIGACVLALSVPLLRPIMLYVGTPELLSFCIFGLSLAAVLAGGTPLKGLAAACVGLLIATAGEDPQTSTLRWTFGALYLWDGLPLVPLALGLFAIPELCDLAIAGKSIARAMPGEMGRNQLAGVRDTFRNKFLLLRCSMIGAALGAVPGIGATVIDWVAYGHAARSEKGAAESFGKGDVRGVIASECSNNAKEGGSLVPTIAFGVPGSASMALILGAFMIHGLVPGPEMLTTHLDVTYTLVWSVALANVFGAGICFFFAGQLARVALVRIGILAPVVLALTYVGAYQGSSHWGDLYALLAFGVLGWIMKRLRWPRPPLMLGFVLGGLIERYLFVSVGRYGWDWIFHPIVLAVFTITAYGILRPVYLNYRRRASADRASRRIAFQKNVVNADTLFALVLIATLLAALVIAMQWEFGARLAPMTAILAGLGFLGALVATNAFIARPEPAPVEAGETPKTDMHFDITMDFGDLDGRQVLGRAGRYFAWCLFFLGAAAVIGILPAMLIFVVAYLRFEGRESWGLTLAIALGLWAISYALFHQMLTVRWPQTPLGDLFPALRAIPELAFF